MSIVAKRYARALMNLAARENQVDAVAAALDDFGELFTESPQLAAFFSEPKVPPAVKVSVVTELLGKIGAPPLVNTFLRYLTQKRRIGQLPSVREVFHEMADERLGRAHADVTVAADLTQKQEERLRQRLESLSGKQINLRVKTDPSILGGIVAQIGSTVWDGSLRHQLNRFHQKLTQG